MKLICIPKIRILLSRVALFVAMFVFPALSATHAAELLMFEQVGCVWCETFDREIAPVYAKTAEGQRAPLRRVNIDLPLPPDLLFVEKERLAPLFVLIENGQEIGRIRGYPGEDHFWGLLGELIKKLGTVGTRGEQGRPFENSLHAPG
jgi:hypothetical protein